MLGMLLRSSAGGLVMYFVLVLLRAQPVRACWPPARHWFGHLQPWVDLHFAQTFLFEGMHTGAQWAHVATAVRSGSCCPGSSGSAG